MFALNSITGKLAQSELVSVIAYLGKAEASPDGFKISVVGVRQSLGQAHVCASTQRDGFFTGNYFFTQAGQRHRDLDGGARLRALTQRQLLVDHGKNASAGGINGNDGAIHVAKRIDSGLAHDGIFALNDVAIGIVVTEGIAGERLNPAMARAAAVQADGL